MEPSLFEIFLAASAREFTGMKLGLHRVKAILEILNHPEVEFPSVLIAGTNGKGSVARLLESFCLKAGLAVGVYTSPHLISFTERIRVGGERILPEEIETILQNFLAMGILDREGRAWTPSGECLSWFETATIIAFEYFRRRQVPLAILEVGLGGRFDATNVIEPIASAIVSIGYDHMQLLGESVFEIAREKAGVMRPGKSVVLGRMQKEVKDFLSQAAELIGAHPISIGKDPEIELGLRGRHQLGNAAVALQLIDILRQQGFSISDEAVQVGFREVRHPGRLEWIDGRPPLLLDGAHNVPAAEALVEYLKELSFEGPLTIALGMVTDKDVRGFFNSLNIFKPSWIFVELPDPRSVKKFQWENFCKAYRLSAIIMEHPNDFLTHWRENQNKDRSGLYLATGSLYFVGKLRELLKLSL